MGDIRCTGGSGNGVRRALVCLTWRKGLEDLNVYRTSAQKGEKVRKDLNGYYVLKQDFQDVQDGQDEGDIRCTGIGDGVLRRLRSLRTLASCS